MGTGLGGFGVSPVKFGKGNTVTITVPGLPAFVGRFKQRGAGLAGRMKRVDELVAHEVKNTAKSLVPVDTGETKRSIRVEIRDDHAVVIADRNGERPEVPIYLELGTFKMAARPFMKPAAEMVMASHGYQKALREIGGLLPPIPGF